MPKRLKQAIGRLAGKKKGRSSAQHAPSGEDQGNGKASFLSLPAEVRNQIYYDVAAETSLVLRATKTKKPVPQNGLLLACKQTRFEARKIFLANCQILIWICDYHFNNVIRAFETLPLDDLAVMKMNPNIWMLLQVSHVPSRDDRRNLKGWIDYRSNKFNHPYFGPNQEAAREISFEYDIRFAAFFRAPQSANRYFNRYDMKLDLLRTHYRMHQRLQRERASDEEPNEELKRLVSNMEESVRLFEDLQLERTFHRSDSVCTVSSARGTTADDPER